MAQRSQRARGHDAPGRTHSGRAWRSEAIRPVAPGVVALLVGALLASAATRADVVRDGRIGSAGAGAVATEIGGGGELRHLIRESDGQRMGNNLFHSFSRFDLSSNEVAVYQGAPEIRNLITSITGGRSSIDGKIQSEIAGANLFLINPDGIVFGEHATVDLSGALTVSSADRLIFSNGEQVEMGGLAPPSILSVADPVGFGFLDAPASISVVGSRIRMKRDQSLSLIGGDIRLSGERDDNGGATVVVPSGRLDLVSLASAGRVFVEEQGIRLEGAPRFGDIAIVDDIVVSTSGLDPSNPFAAVFSELIPGSGPIFVRADDLTLRDAQVRSVTATSEDAGDVVIGLTGTLMIVGGARPEATGIFADTGVNVVPAEGESVSFRFSDSTHSAEGTVIEVDVCTTGSFCGVRYVADGDAGDVKIRARDVRLLNGGKIRATSEFQGDAGTIEIAFRDEMIVAGRRGPSDVSQITTNANSPIRDLRSGDPGTIVIRSDEGKLRMDDFGALIIQNGLFSPADGGPGRIQIDVAELLMAGNARIDSSTRGAGPGGVLDIRARDRISLSGRTDDQSFTGISTLSQPGSTGNAGEIRVATRDLVLRRGAEISARPADATSQGAAGNLRFEIGDRLVMRGATISTESPNAAGGNIDLAVAGLVSLRGSSITTSVTRGPESGGNITLRPGPDALVLSNSQIIARADTGAGGTIDLEAGLILADDGSAIDASSRLGVDGLVLINGVEGNIVPEVAQLATPAADASSLVREPCAARQPGSSNRFVIDERPRLAADADDYLGASLALALAGDGPRAGGDRAASGGHREPLAGDAAPDSRAPTRLAQEDRAASSGCVF